MLKKKPEGASFEEWCLRWDASDHAGKKELCRQCGVSYETGRHWRSDSEVPLPVKEPDFGVGDGNAEGGLTETVVRTEAANQILAAHTTVDLDFVSFDIETTDLKADWGILLCGAIKPWGKDAIVFRADEYPFWNRKRTDDSEIVTDIATELRKHAVVITHYGHKFDIPYLRAKMVKYGLAPLPPMFGVDTLQIARQSFKVGSRKLGSLADYFDIGRKEEMDVKLWLEARIDGAKASLDEIVSHNVMDTILLEKLASLSFPYLKSLRRV